MSVLKFVKIDGCTINAETGELKIRDLHLRFDPNEIHLEIDFLDAIELALQALREGTIHQCHVH